MDFEMQDQLARSGDWSKEACSLRTRAAIIAAGFASWAEFARKSGQTTTALGNQLNSGSFPSRKTMRALWRLGRIDPLFILDGDYTRLENALRARLLAALESESNGRDRPADSD